MGFATGKKGLVRAKMGQRRKGWRGKGPFFSFSYATDSQTKDGIFVVFFFFGQLPPNVQIK